MPAVFAEIGYFVIDYLGVNVAVADAIATIIEYAAVLELLNIAQNALSPSQKSGVGQGLLINYASTEASIRVIYGTVKCAGMQTIPPITYGQNGEFLASVITYAGHKIDSFGDTYFDSNQIPSGNIGAITGASSDGVVTLGSLPYDNVAWIRRYDGRQTSADWILANTVSPTTFGSFIGRGITNVAYSWKFDPNVYQSVPNPVQIINGKRIYDPRLDSTVPGGSGTQRVATESTWAFSKNPALALADYLLASYGGEYDPSDIDWSTVIAAANVCDFVLTGANSTPDGDQPRYTCNGAMLSTQGGGGQPFSDNVKLLVNAMLGRVINANGIWSMFAGSWQTPNANIIDKTSFTSGLTFTFEQGRAKRFNAGHVWFVDPNQNWQRVECAPRINATYQSFDGETLPFETDQPFCTVEKEAQRKGEFLLRQSRNQVTMSGKLLPKYSGIKLWDTVQVNYPEFGWILKTFRVAACTMNADGSLDVTLSEEQATDWTDLLTAEYNNPSVSAVPTSISTTPSAPTNFSISTVNGTIGFAWSPGQITPKFTRYQLVSYPGSLSNPSSKQVIWQGDATNASLQYTTNSPFWVQVQAFSNSNFGAYNPNTFGIQVIPNYMPPAVVASTWQAYMSGAGNVSGTAASIATGLITAVVVSPTAPVYSWTLNSISGGSMSMNFGGVGSASVSFAAFGMSPGDRVTALAACHIVDGANVGSLSLGIAIRRNSIQ